MSLFSRWRSWSRSATHRARLEEEMETEMRAHIEHRAADLERGGMAHAEALLRAQREFGALDLRKEECRDSLGLRLWDGLRADVRLAVRSLRQNPAFMLLAIACLTLGIGANAAVFSWIEGSVLRPYPAVAHQDTLVVVAGTTRGVSGYNGLSWPDLQDLQRNSTLLDAVIAEKITGATLNLGDRAERAVGSMVSTNYFDALGIRPFLGRGFQPGEDVGRNGHPVVVISYQMWKDRFHGDPGVIGRTQLLNGVPHTMVGVAPRGFYGTFVGYAWQFWVPASMQETFDSSGYELENRGARWIEGFARLKPGVSIQQAQQEVEAVSRRLETAYPATNRGHSIRLLPLWESPFNGTKIVLPTLAVTMVVVFFVLLIACANVSNLLLVKAFGRRHEMTVRLALGAGRGRLIRQLLTEGLFLALLGGVGGILVAYWCHNTLALLLPSHGVPIYVPGEIDWRVAALSAGTCLLATLLFALVPAVQTSNVDLAGSLKCESAGVIGGRGRAWLRSTLVLLQVALSFLLLVGAGLLLQSMRRIHGASPGFDADHVLVTGIDLFASGYDGQRARNAEEQILERVRGISGVESASFSRILPFSYRSYSSGAIAVDGYQAAPDEQPTVEYDEVTPQFFATLGIPLREGRDFTLADDANAVPVAIVNQTMASRYWRGEDPIGKRVQVNGKWLHVIGVARDSKYSSMMEPATPFLYVPLRQNPSTQVGLEIRTSVAAGTMATALARELHAVDPGLSMFEVITLREQVERQNGTQQTAVLLLGTFGGLALLLAVVGLYGVMSYAVSQGTREMGLRMALGAAPRDLMRLVLSHALTLTLVGVAVGAGAALLTTRLLGYLLYQVSPRDPGSFAAALGLMVAAAIVACMVPARRASRTDPLRALRIAGN